MKYGIDAVRKEIERAEEFGERKVAAILRQYLQILEEKKALDYPAECASRLLDGFNRGLKGKELLKFSRGAKP